MVYDALMDKRNETALEIKWDEPLEGSQERKAWRWHQGPRSKEIEIADYALLCTQGVDFEKALKILRYIVSQKNCFGGYGSSYDTVLSIKAIAKMVKFLKRPQGKLDIHITPDHGDAVDATVKKNNYLSLQNFDLDPKARHLSLSSGKGSSGIAAVSFTVKFNQIGDGKNPSFNITHISKSL